MAPKNLLLAALLLLFLPQFALAGGGSIPDSDSGDLAGIDVLGRENLAYTNSLDTVGTGISTASGAYQLAWPMLAADETVGPRFILYSSNDRQSPLFYTPNDFPRTDRYNTRRFFFAPHAKVKYESSNGFITFFLDDGRSVAFESESLVWSVYEGELGDTENGQAERFSLTQSGDYFFLTSPWRSTVSVFKTDETDMTRLEYVLNRDGRQLAYSYALPTDANPTSISDGSGNILSLTYQNLPGIGTHLTRVADEAGRDWDFLYSQNPGNGGKTALIAVNDAASDSYYLAYDDVRDSLSQPGSYFTYADNIASLSGPDNNKPTTRTFEFFLFGQLPGVGVTDQTNPLAQSTSLAYNTTNAALTVTHSDGRTETFDHFAPLSVPEAYTDGMGATAAFTRNTHEQVASILDRQGLTTAVTYHEGTGLPARVTNAAGGVTSFTYTQALQTFTNPATGTSFEVVFHDLTRVDYPDGSFETYAYNGAGQVTAFTDRAGNTWSATYDANQHLAEVTNPLGGVTSFSYDAMGRPATRTSPESGTASFGYDAAGRLSSLSYGSLGAVTLAHDPANRPTSLSDELGRAYSLGYNSNNLLGSLTTPSGATASIAYDLADRVASVTNHAGETTQFSYDGDDRLTSLTPGAGPATSYGYDARGYPSTRTIGTATFTRSYSAEGFLTAETAPSGAATTYTRDNVGNVLSVTRGSLSPTTYTRDAMGRMRTRTTPMGLTTTYGWAATARGEALVSLTTPGGVSASRSVSATGLATSVTDFLGNTFSQTMDTAGRPALVTDPLGRETAYSYDARGRTAGVTYPDGVSETVATDGSGRVTSRLFSDGTSMSYSYDADGRPSSSGLVSLAYDGEGRPTATSYGVEAYGADYDGGGRLSQLSYAGNLFLVTYQYDAATGLLTSVRDNLTGTEIGLGYDADMRLTSIERSHDVDTAIAWTSANTIASHSHLGILSRTFSYNKDGSLRAASGTLPLDPEPALASPANARYEYDAAGQRVAPGYAYDERGRMTASPSASYTWDGAGRLTSVQQGEEITLLTYDDMGHLYASLGADNHILYRNFALPGAPVVAERESEAGPFLRFYVYAPWGQLLYVIRPTQSNSVLHVHTDYQGSIVALTTSAGYAEDRYAYSPTGRMVDQLGTTALPLGYRGGSGTAVSLPMTGLTLFGTRAYSPEEGIFLAPADVLPGFAEPGDLNRYAYAGAQFQAAGADFLRLAQAHYLALPPAPTPTAGAALGTGLVGSGRVPNLWYVQQADHAAFWQYLARLAPLAKGPSLEPTGRAVADGLVELRGFLERLSGLGVDFGGELGLIDRLATGPAGALEVSAAPVSPAGAPATAWPSESVIGNYGQ